MTYLKLATVTAIVAGILWGAHWLFQRGVDSATIDITKANSAASDKADAAERCVLAGKWNKETGKCQK